MRLAVHGSNVSNQSILHKGDRLASTFVITAEYEALHIAQCVRGDRVLDRIVLESVQAY